VAISRHAPTPFEPSPHRICVDQLIPQKLLKLRYSSRCVTETPPNHPTKSSLQLRFVSEKWTIVLQGRACPSAGCRCRSAGHPWRRP